MVTQLVEGFNRKADQFWPEVGDEVKVRGDVKVAYKASYTEGILTIRQFVILLPDGGKREVTLVQPEDWADLGTADGPRQLFEVLQHTNQMWRSSSGPLLMVLFLRTCFTFLNLKPTSRSLDGPVRGRVGQDGHLDRPLQTLDRPRGSRLRQSGTSSNWWVDIFHTGWDGFDQKGQCLLCIQDYKTFDPF